MEKVKIVAYYAINLPVFEMLSHTHDHYEFMYAADGECQIQAQGEWFTLKANEFVFIRKGTPHQLRVLSGHPCILLNLEFAVGGEGNLDLAVLRQKNPDFAAFWQEIPAYRCLCDTEKVCYALKDLIAELERETSSPYLLELLLARLLIETSRCHGGRNTGVIYVNRARTFISAHFDQELTVATVAAQVGVNPSYLQTLFSRHVGCGIISYVNTLRLEKACFMLKHSNKSVTDIAFLVGFNSRQQFFYNFEKRYGQSPRAYRKLMSQFVEVDTATMRQL